jgi:hypothetical protein
MSRLLMSKYQGLSPGYLPCKEMEDSRAIWSATRPARTAKVHVQMWKEALDQGSFGDYSDSALHPELPDHLVLRKRQKHDVGQ